MEEGGGSIVFGSFFLSRGLMFCVMCVGGES